MAFVGFLHQRNMVARQAIAVELKERNKKIDERLEHLDGCIDKTNRDISALRLFMASNYSKQEIQEHWDRRDIEVNHIIEAMGRHDTSIAVITSELMGVRVALDRIVTKMDRD